MNVCIEKLIKEYKRNNGIKEKGYPEKIKARFQGLDGKVMNLWSRKIYGMEYVNFSCIIYEKLKRLDIKLSKPQLGNLVRIKFENRIEVKFRVERETNKFNKLIKEKFTKVF